ncbi:MAG: hypothetical protein ACTHZ9_07260 [Leucobacter sp.]
MDLRWLSAPEREVAEAMAQVRKTGRPKWVPTKRQVLVHINHCLMLWYLGIVWVTLGVRIDTLQENRIEPNDIRDIIFCTAIFLLWMYGTYWLYRWAAKPPSRRARMGEWRQALTALANGFEPEPSRTAKFASMITSGPDRPLFYPRFVHSGIEFGNLRFRKRRSGSWTYAAFQLPVPLPHFIFESRARSGLFDDLPVAIGRRQRLPLEGDFDRWFHLHVPLNYERDALTVITPDVMAVLIDRAHGFNIEMIDDYVVFFSYDGSDFTTPGPWLTIESLLQAAASVVANAGRYRDERIAEQQASPTIAMMRAAVESPGTPWNPPTPRIGPSGHRLEMRDRRSGVWSVVGAIGWVMALAFLYAVPGIFAFAGIMSIVDGH